MKIPGTSHPISGRRRGGFAVIVMLILLALVLGFIMANLHALSGLHSELKIIEKKQIHRLNRSATNAVPQAPALTTTNLPMTAQAMKPRTE